MNPKNIPGQVVHVLSGEDYDLYVDRARPIFGLNQSFWSNPFVTGSDETRTLRDALAAYEQRIRDNAPLVQNVFKLHGRTLGCGCNALMTKNKDYKALQATVRDKERCHGQTLLRLAHEQVLKSEKARAEQELRAAGGVRDVNH